VAARLRGKQRQAQTGSASSRKLRRTFASETNEVAVGCRKFHSVEFLNLFSSPCIVKMTKSRRTEWVLQTELSEGENKSVKRSGKGRDFTED
jgi:hypothetical protein